MADVAAAIANTEHILLPFWRCCSQQPSRSRGDSAFSGQATLYFAILPSGLLSVTDLVCATTNTAREMPEMVANKNYEFK